MPSGVFDSPCPLSLNLAGINTIKIVLECVHFRRRAGSVLVLETGPFMYYRLTFIEC